MLSKSAAVLISVFMLFMLFMLFSGCRPDSLSDSITIVAGAEPAYIDPGLSSTVDGGVLINHCFEGLTAVDRNGKTIPGAAKRWKVFEDATMYTFTLRDCSWSDGQPVRAQDFEYAWKRLISPVTASYCKYFGFCLLNGEKYYQGIVGSDDVGVKATDDKTLEVRLESPMPYFLDMLHFSCFCPVRKDIVEKYGERWTHDPSTYVCNGAFMMKEWVHDDRFVIVKNPVYWNKSKIRLQQIEFRLNSDYRKAMCDFESGALAMNYRHIPPDEIPRLVSEGKAEILPDLATYYYVINVGMPPLDDIKVRQALSLAIDRKYIVGNILKAGQKPSAGWVPRGIPGMGANKDFRSEAPVFISESADPDTAGKLLAEAGYPDGHDFPVLEIIHNSSEGHKMIAEAIKAMWKQNLGIKVRVSEKEWVVFQNLRENKDFQIAKDGWGGDYEDAMTFMELFVTDGVNNSTNWGNAEYDRLIKKAQSTAENNIRLQAMHDAERILMDEMPIIPIYDYTTAVMIDPGLKDCHISALGHIYLHYAYMRR